MAQANAKSRANQAHQGANPMADVFAELEHRQSGSEAGGSDALRKAMVAAQAESANSLANFPANDADQFPYSFLEEQRAMAAQQEMQESMRRDVGDKRPKSDGTSLFDAGKLAEQGRIAELTSQLNGNSGQSTETNQSADAIATAENGDPAAMDNFTENDTPLSEQAQESLTDEQRMGAAREGLEEIENQNKAGNLDVDQSKLNQKKQQEIMVAEQEQAELKNQVKQVEQVIPEVLKELLKRITNAGKYLHGRMSGFASSIQAAFKTQEAGQWLNVSGKRNHAKEESKAKGYGVTKKTQSNLTNPERNVAATGA